MRAFPVRSLTPLFFAFSLTADPLATFRQNCFGCHGQAAATAGINLEKLTADLAANPKAIGGDFVHWDKVAAVLEQKRMPPPKMKQPTDADRVAAAAWVRTKLDEFARKNAGDPGRVTMRRLTSGEYAYTVRDLTGLDFKLDNDFVPDEVGGEGFTSFGDVQFMQDASLERYLGTAKKIADHAVIGSGPLGFYNDPGKSGFELSAIHRIQGIYNTYGFRAASGEGGKPYGMDRYGKAFYAAWRYANRGRNGEPRLTLEQAAKAESVTPKFIQHLLGVLQQENATHPTSALIDLWKKMPAANDPQAARESAAAMQRFVTDWPRWLLGAGPFAEGGDGDERNLALGEDTVRVETKYRFRMAKRRQRTDGPVMRVYFMAVAANPAAAEKAVVTWKNPRVRFGRFGATIGARPTSTEAAFVKAIDEESRKRLGLDANMPADAPVIFQSVGDTQLYVDIPLPEAGPEAVSGAGFASLEIEAEIDTAKIGSGVVRVSVSETPDLSKGRPVSVLMGNAKDPGFATFRQNVLAYAAGLPTVSHGEPTPADRDPIPAPFNNTYNQPERDRYHQKVIYYRSDKFIVDKMLPDDARVKLDQAWNDLYASFGYHDQILNFVGDKYKIPALAKGQVKNLTGAEIAALPEEPRKYVQALKTEYDAVQKAQLAAQPGHIEDVLKFAARAWRRPLTDTEKDRLRRFYTQQREVMKQDHDKAVRAMVTRVLVSPAFLYRSEQGGQQLAATKALSSHEMASRLSYLLWSSAPDAELQRAATAGELAQPAGVEKQIRRMIADPKARRMATEFFGQWLGFYRFDQYRGVDAQRFPEFTAEVKAAMYDEAISFFEHILRQNRPVREMFTADYTFLNQTLAKHYGIKKEVKAEREVEMVKGASEFHRGGVLSLGAVLTATSAPLRTSPVKRGDWVLRRILGTPTPPPPADAGSIPADEKLFGGLTLKARLEAHKRNATCAACHLRIDPLGFPLESFDAVGRWRNSYSDGKPVEVTATSFEGKTLDGASGLAAYLQDNEPQVLKNLSHKLIGYALGRTVLASDKLLVDDMVKAGGNATFSQLIVRIATSPQFRYRKEQPEQSAVPTQPKSVEAKQIAAVARKESNQ